MSLLWEEQAISSGLWAGSCGWVFLLHKPRAYGAYPIADAALPKAHYCRASPLGSPSLKAARCHTQDRCQRARVEQHIRIAGKRRSSGTCTTEG